MRLRRLSLKNVRQFKSLDVDIDQLTVLVGPNHSGKSTILDAVACLIGRPRDRQWEATDFRPLAERRAYGFESQRQDVVEIVGEFTNLSERDASSFAHLLQGDAIHLGVLFDSGPRMGPFAVVRSVSAEMEANSEFVRHVSGDDVWVGTADGPWSPTGGFVHDKRAVQPPSLVHIRHPSEGPVQAADVLAPFLREVLRTAVDYPSLDPAGLADRAHGAYEVLEQKFQAAATAYLGRQIAFELREPFPEELEEALVDLLTRNVLLIGDSQDPGVARPLDRAGMGTRRAAAIAALEMYLDPELGARRPTIILIDEPELGLQASGQRRLAASLARLRDNSTVQVILATHSPILWDVAPASVSVVRPATPSVPAMVVRADGVDEVLESLGVELSDVLLAKTIVIVEGSSDSIAFEKWMTAIGHKPRLEGVKFFPAGGWTMVQAVAKFHEMLYPGAAIHCIVDAGDDIVIRAPYGVVVHQLQRTELESYYSVDAVKAWLLLNGGEVEAASAFEQAGTGEAVRILNGISNRAIRHGRAFDKVRDGATIVSFMTEADIDPEIKGIITTIAARPDG